MDDIELIKQRINIVDLIQEYLPLKKAGVNYRANCPFHQEHTPSFMVSPERGIFHCFGCQKGGDIFKFVMEKENVEFKEALEILAQKAGVQLKQTSSKKNPNEVLFEVHEKAVQFYNYLLTEHPIGKKALEYLYDRGLTDETINAFKIGYAPQSWETLTRFLKKRGFTTQDLIISGLCVQSQRGCYDRFRGRIMFPLVNVRNQTIGFSGRVLGVGEPKYVNSPQTPIFDKGKFLFGINLSKGKIKEKDLAIVVEGDMDMIMSYQSGVKNVVASKGTALTEDQVELVKRYTNTLDLCFDTDLAGDAATRRGIEIADKAGLNLKVIKVEGAKDPAELCLKDVNEWEKAVEQAIPIYDYYLQSVMRRFDIKSASSKRAIYSELLPIWQKISDPIVKDHYIQKLAALLQVKQDLIRNHMEKMKPDFKMPTVTLAKQAAKSEPKEGIHDRRQLLEEYLIALLLHIPVDHTYVPGFPETLFTRENLRQIYVMLVLFFDTISFQGKAFKISDFIATLPEELIPNVDELYLRPIEDKLDDKKHWQKELDSVIMELKKMLIKNSLEKLSLQIKSAQEFEKAEQLDLLNRRFRDLSVKLKNL